MVIYTMTKKQILRIIVTVLVCLVAVLLIIFAVFGSVTASADTGKKPVYCVERGDNKIALTFNCAWDAGDINALLEKLSDTKATFFVTGEFCDTHPDAVRKISAGGHSVQNLTDKNIHIKDMNINDLIADIKACSAKIKTLTGKEPTMFRAPFGDYDDKSLTTIEGMGLLPLDVSVDSHDLDDPNPDSVRKHVLDSVTSGSIILMHNDCAVTEETLPSLITGLKQKGFEPVRTEELVFTDNYIISDKGVQQYRPVVSTVLPIVYSDTNTALDSAFEKMRVNLTIQEIYDLSSVGRVGLIDKIKAFLNDSELYAMREATYEELMDCYMTLVYAAEKYGAGGTYTEPKYEEIPEIIPVPESEDGEQNNIPNDEIGFGITKGNSSDNDGEEILK